MSALKSAHDLPNEGQMLASISGSAALGRAKMLLFVVGGACTLLFLILALVLPGAPKDDDHGHHGEEVAMVAADVAPVAEVGGEHDDAEHAADSAPKTNWKGSMAYSWLFAVMFFMTLCVGGIFWTLLHNASNSGWGILVRRLMENMGSVIPLMFVLMLPLIVLPEARDALWEWLPLQAELTEKAEAYADEHLADAKQEYAAGVDASKAALAEVKAEVEPLLADASPGYKYHLEERISVADELVKEAEAEAKLFSSDSAVREELETHFMKEGDGAGEHGDILLYKKKGFLNKDFWLIRYILYAVALSGIILLMRAWSIRQDATGEAKFTLLSRRWSCGLLPLFAVAWTFLVFDWLMALDYTWFSTMWGVYLFAGCALSSMSLLILVMTLLIKNGAFGGLINKEHYHIMGKLMHSFVIFWAYIAFSQFFLIWYANITEETKFYLTRNTEFWNGLTISLLVIGHFVLPFAVLLIRAVKTTPKVVVWVCLWNIAMQIFDIYWIIIPERGPSLTSGAMMSIPGAFILDILAWVAVGGLAGAFFLHRLGQASLYPARDPRMDESLNLVN